MKQQTTAESSKGQGLCSNCGARDECVLSRTNKGPVNFCEEYWTTNSKADLDKPIKKKDETKPPVQHQTAGLCINCLNRDDCRLSKNKGGVWYCEEYE
jgi:hypothetical protein